MLPYDMYYLAHRERYEAFLKQATQERLARGSMLQQTDNKKVGIAAVHWIGVQMVKWRCILQQERGTTMPCCSQATP